MYQCPSQMSLKASQCSKSLIVLWPFCCFIQWNGFQTGQRKCVGNRPVHLSCTSSSVRLVSLCETLSKYLTPLRTWTSTYWIFSGVSSLLGRGREVVVYLFLKVHKISLFWPRLTLIPGHWHLEMGLQSKCHPTVALTHEECRARMCVCCGVKLVEDRSMSEGEVQLVRGQGPHPTYDKAVNQHPKILKELLQNEYWIVCLQLWWAWTFLAIKLLKASGKLIFQLVILKKPNFQLMMMMKNLIFSCPEKGRKRYPCLDGYLKKLVFA